MKFTITALFIALNLAAARAAAEGAEQLAGSLWAAAAVVLIGGIAVILARETGRPAV